MAVLATVPSVGTRDYSAEEWGLRVELARFYRLVDYFGWTELIFNHISVRLPGPDHHYLMNPFGLNYDEVTPDNLITVALDGTLARQSEYKANPAGFSLHGAIHSTREDVLCVAHTHSIAVSAVAMKQGGISHDNFYGAQLIDRVAYHDFEGITINPGEMARMVQSLGDKHVLVLRNHGIAVCERDIPNTFVLLWKVQRAAEVQCQAGMLPGPNIALSKAVGQNCVEASDYLMQHASFCRLMFDATVRKMERERGGFA
ncbi:class II aldolase/adducin family protein [Sphingomonas sp.]|uniref:class II aldolase/adducin family protein n=1 Tax=Sphingomonas sp. TaxID=28214 RepID=UPI000DAFB14B|nr:class II aldolase/adducin family protein [Sphingomonas sp.]PZU11039.1 MAG: class II aldolase [Sphingomonas sp.]